MVIKANSTINIHILYSLPFLTELSICVKVLLCQSSPWPLVNKEGFRARKFILLKWFLLGGLLSWAYLSTLLATLVVIEYEKTIDTIDDMDQSGMPFLLPEATAPHKLVATDPRPAMRRIFKRSIMYPLDRGARAAPKWAIDM